MTGRSEGAARYVESHANMRSVSAKGSISSQFRRALDAGNAMTAYELAREVPRVTLEDALRLCLILAQAQDWRYERAAKRWLQRFSAEAHPSLAEVLMAGAAPRSGAFQTPRLRGRTRWSGLSMRGRERTTTIGCGSKLPRRMESSAGELEQAGGIGADRIQRNGVDSLQR